MKRFKVQTRDNHTLLLYYPTKEKAQENYPDAIVTEHTDQSYVEYIEQMLATAVDCKTAERNGSTVYLLRFNTSVGTCLVLLHRDLGDDIWYDFCEYQLWKSGMLLAPVTKTLSTPAEFCKKFLFPAVEYRVLCMGKRGEVKKPQILKGIQKFATVDFVPKKCACQLFLDNQDLYIKHNDYFSPMYCRPEDAGTPLSYRAKKYDIKENPREKFIYVDNWGAIVLRRVAWIKVTNFIHLVHHMNDMQVSATVWSMLRSYHRWSDDEQNGEWERFLETVAVTTRRYLNKGLEV